MTGTVSNRARNHKKITDRIFQAAFRPSAESEAVEHTESFPSAEVRVGALQKLFPLSSTLFTEGVGSGTEADEIDVQI